MDPPEEIEMSAEEDTFSLPAAAVSFQLQLDKPIPFQARYFHLNLFFFVLIFPVCLCLRCSIFLNHSTDK